MSELPQLYLIRHGETAWSITGQHTGFTDIALTAHGQDEARALAPCLLRVHFTRILTSPLQRARQTCELAGLGGEAEIEADLTEWNYGDYEGQRTVDIHRGRPGWNVWRDGCPHGETPDNMSDRAEPEHDAMNSGLGESVDQYRQAERDREETGRREHDDPHLRSCNAVMKYHLRATDGDIGHVHALLVDDETWAIRYLIVETSNWWLGHQVLIAPKWIDDVDWFDCKVSVDLTRQAVKDAPPYDAAMSLNRVQEMGIHEHYGRPGYWAVEGESGAAGSRR